MTDPIRERHRICSPFNSEGPFQHCICAHAPDIYPCDAIRAADERDAARADADRLAALLVDVLGADRYIATATNDGWAKYAVYLMGDDLDAIRAALRAHDEATR